MPADISALFAMYMASENYDAAEHLCRVTLLKGTDATRSDALLGLAMLARELGRNQHYEIFLSALAHPAAEKMLVDAMRVVRPSRRPGDNQKPRYLVINAWPTGFWSSVSHVAGCCMLAWLTGRIPVTNWRLGCLYSDSLDQDGFQAFFGTVSDVRVEHLALQDLQIFPAYWTYDILLGKGDSDYPSIWSGPGITDVMRSDADVVICDKYIQPSAVLDWIIPSSNPGPDDRIAIASDFYSNMVAGIPGKITESVEKFILTHFNDTKFTAIHLRGADKKTEFLALESENYKILDLAAQISPSGPIFIMTDDVRWLEIGKRKFGDRVITADVVRSANDFGVHNAPREHDRVELGYQILLDTLIGAQADLFIGLGSSNVAATIDLLRFGVGRRTLISPANQLLDRRDWGTIRW